MSCGWCIDVHVSCGGYDCLLTSMCHVVGVAVLTSMCHVVGLTGCGCVDVHVSCDGCDWV